MTVERALTAERPLTAERALTYERARTVETALTAKRARAAQKPEHNAVDGYAGWGPGTEAAAPDAPEGLEPEAAAPDAPEGPEPEAAAPDPPEGPESEAAAPDPPEGPESEAAAPDAPEALGPEAAEAADPGAAEAGDPDAAEELAPDAAEELEEEIVSLAAHIGAATHRLLVLLARFERLRTWDLAGHRTCAHWLSFATGYDLGTAREHVRVARALESLPLIAAAMAKGDLSFSQVRALTRVAEPASEAALLELARGCPTAYLEREVRAWRKGTRQDEAARERERYGSRTLSVFPDDDGMYVVRGRVTPEVGAVLMRAIEAAGDALFQARPVPGVDTEREAARRRADAVGLLAERALAAGFGGTGGERESGADECGTDESGADACGRAGSEAPVSGTRAERYLAFLHVDADTLSQAGEPGRSHLGDGTRVSPETSRRLTCDCSLVRVTRGGDGSILDVGRKTRSIPPALRRALEVRDRGCRFPGCNARFTAAHHVIHWADQGPTSLANCLLLCRHHHRLVHEGGWSVEWWGEGRPAFHDPRGQVHFDGGWQPPKLGDQPVGDLVRGNRRRGIRPDPWRQGPRWKREAEIPTGVLLRAMEAVD